MASPSHYIRTVHTPYTKVPSAWTTYSSAGRENTVVELRQSSQPSKYPPGLGLSAWRASVASLASVDMNQIHLSSSGGSGSKRPQRPSLRLSYQSSSMSPSQPPAPSHRASPAYSGSIASRDPSYRLSSYSTSSNLESSPSSHRTIQLTPQPAPAFDRDARSKLVAGILLHRVHAVGKPMRRRPGDVCARGYVRSGLSRMVSVEA